MQQMIELHQAGGSFGSSTIGGSLLLVDLIAFMVVCATWRNSEDGGRRPPSPPKRRSFRPRKRG